MMNRIDRIFRDLSERGGKALMPFITAGDPDLATTAALLPELEKAGASIVELGIAFSDPVADGPVIQASMKYVLDQQVRVNQVFDMVASVRPKVELGLVAMVSYSIVHRIGLHKFIADAAAAGLDGFIFPDLPLEEADETVKAVRDAGLIMSMLIAPTTPIERAKKIAQASSGFIYLLSRAGTTGERSELPPELPQRIDVLRQTTDLPIVVGFGVSNSEQVRQVVSVADAAIVGSAIMRRIADNRQQGQDAVVREVGTFAGELASGLDAAGTTSRSS